MIRTELQLRLPNSPGSLANVATILAAERVRVLAVSLESSGLARLVVDNHERAYGVLTARHLRVDKRDVIYTMISERSLDSLLTSVARAGVNVEYAYASSPDSDGMTALVLGVEDAARASAAAGV